MGKLTNKQMVLRKWPEAAYCSSCRVIHKWRGGAGEIGRPRNADEAWADAARRIGGKGK